MTAVLVLLPQILQLVPLATTGLQHLIAWIAAVRSAAKQSREWTPELEAEFEAMLTRLGSSQAWQPDKPPIYPIHN